MQALVDRPLDAQLLKLGLGLAAGGLVSAEKAARLWAAAVAGRGASQRRKNTLDHLLAILPFTDKARAFLLKRLGGLRLGRCAQLDGERCSKGLLEAAESACQAETLLSRTTALRLARAAQDARGGGDCERRTLALIREHFPCGADAAEVLQEAAASRSPRRGPVAAVGRERLSAPLLRLADELALRGAISKAGVRQLATLAGLPDAPGVTLQERRTLEHVLKAFQFTAPARRHLRELLEVATVIAPAGLGPAAAARPELADELPAGAEAPDREVLRRRELKARARAQRLEEERRREALALEYGALFDGIDENRDGVISEDEFQRYVAMRDEFFREKYGVQDWPTLLKEMDLDGDGRVTREEFVAYFSIGGPDVDPERVFSALFHAMDESGDGALQVEEINDYLWYKNPNLSLVISADAARDHGITQDEFVAHLEESIGRDAESVKAFKRMMFEEHAGRASGSGFETPSKRPRGAGGDWRGCWDFAAGRCQRGEACHWLHDRSPDTKVLGLRRKRCAQELADAGLDLGVEARMELQSLPEEEAFALIRSLAPGGAHGAVPDKDVFVCKATHRRHAEAALLGTPPQGPLGKRRRLW